MNDSLKVGLVGVGGIAETHLAVLAAQPRATLEFTVDPYKPRPPACHGLQTPHYAQLVDALKAHRPDLVVIASPTGTHADLAIQALTLSSAQVLVEKPLADSLDSLARLREETTDARGRLFTAHHFAFAPEVRWAAQQIIDHPEWGPITDITSAFYDPYVLKGEQAFASYISSWMDSGVNQLSMLFRFVDVTTLTSIQETANGASAWCIAEFRSAGNTGFARLHSSWLTEFSSKKTALILGGSGVEVWMDHTAMTGFAAQGRELLDVCINEGHTPRKVAHYRPLYESLLSRHPDVMLSFGVAEIITELQHSTSPRSA